MQCQYIDGEELPQEEFDAEAFIADINAILTAPRREPTLEERRVAAWRVVYALDQFMGAPYCRWTTVDEFARGQAMLEALDDKPEPWQPPANDDPTPALDVVLDLQFDPAPVRHLENRRPRRSLARDRRNAEKSERYFEEELTRAGRPLVRAPSPSSKALNDNQEKTKSTPKKTHSNDNDRRQIASWKDTKDFGRFIAINRAAAVNDNDWCASAHAFTLNLSPDVIARGLASRHNGFASWIQKRIAAELAKVVRRVVEFALAVDVTRSGRPHLHGVIVVGVDELPAAEEALRRAGGTWAAKCADRQVDTRPVWDADGWASYSARNAAAARKVVGASIMACTAGLKAAAKALHERLRRNVLAAAA